MFKTHLNPSESNLKVLKKNNIKKIVVSYRDLRDVALARYYRLLKFPKKKNEPYYLPPEKQYKNISKEEGMNDCIKVICEFVPNWIFNWFEISKREKGLILFVSSKILSPNQKKNSKRF